MGKSFKHTADAAYKLRVYFRDGKAASLFSRDWRGKLHDPEAGRIALENYVSRKATAIQSALIYDKRSSPDRLILKFQDGTWRALGDPVKPQIQPI